MNAFKLSIGVCALAAVGIAQFASADDVAKYDSNMRVDDSSANVWRGCGQG